MGVNQYLIVASHNIKVKNLVKLQYFYLVYPIIIVVIQYHLGCIKVKFRVYGITWTKKQ
jgi:hypothetical protein